MRADVDLLLGHDERTVEQTKIADRAATVLAQRKGADGVTGNMVADGDGTRLFVAQHAKNLRGLTIKSIAKLDVRWDRVVPPIVFHMSILLDVAHVRNFPAG